jgi:hypothetical protein
MAYTTFEDAMHFLDPHYPGRFLHQAWRDLERGLAEDGYTVYEFIHFAVHHLNDAGWANMQRRNLLCTPKVMVAFKSWKTERMEDVRNAVLYQNKTFELYMRSDHDPVELLHTCSELNPVVRLEQALHLHHQGVLPARELDLLLKQYTTQAVTLAAGNPEYMAYAPLFREYAMSKEHEEPWRILKPVRRL